MHTNTLRSFCLCILQQRYNSHWMSSSTPSTPKSNWKTLNRNRSGITKHVIKIAYESFPLCSRPCQPAGTERSPQSVTYWRMWVPRCRSVDKIEKLISFVDTWESDRSDFFLLYLYVVIHVVHEILSSIFVTPVFFTRHFSEDRKQTDQDGSKIHGKNQSSSVMLASIYPIIMCRGFSGNTGRFLIKPMFCCILMERQSFVWLQLRCWCRLFPVGVKTAYPETK